MEALKRLTVEIHLGYLFGEDGFGEEGSGEPE